MTPQPAGPRQLERPVPSYGLPDSGGMPCTTNMPATMTPAMAVWPQTQPAPPSTMGWADPSLQEQVRVQYPHQSMMQSFMQPVRPPSINSHRPQHDMGPRPMQSGPWTAREDDILVKARSQGLAWEEIHKQCFPNKTGNACRKRHDRLLIKARDPTWDEARIQKVVYRYNRARESMWRPIADQVGERWEDVEKVGCRGLKSRSRQQHGRNRSRASSGQTGLSEWEQDPSPDEHDNTDDSGISVGLSGGGHSRRSSEIAVTGSRAFQG
ncbi:hypothetical protein PV08_04276 [Exophiala spinifera]|uniref:Myb-like domain-containing protein n=1 Tax=Exophiala spinifera TaxID=91928 RepID=A0A0D2BER2_9EURO|nr:uncharacterized protein PV08_04276 [Exophiala spinifera]KIW17085.1 hypothetical protein PV08_04276 [Exophiala spinifera]